ncbi:TlpA family protein disulfide reductase [Aerococcaceae bacterium DSM 111020]|nr:TlpA family protein disulfide reductase [Aerococcaceae bacterium DSM 111020]
MKRFILLVIGLVLIFGVAFGIYQYMTPAIESGQSNEERSITESIAVMSDNGVSESQSMREQTVHSSDKGTLNPVALSSNDETNKKDETLEESTLDELSVVRRIRFEDQDGNVKVLSDYVGKPIVLNIWASWCEPCRREMPLFEQAMSDYPQVQFVMLNAVGSNQIETKESADAFLEEQGFDFPVVYDYRRLTQLNLGVHMLPTTLFIDASGEIRYTQVGEISGDQLTSLIETELLSEVN